MVGSRKLKGILGLVFAVFLIRLALVLPGDSDHIPEPVFFDLNGQSIEAGLPEIANIVYYFVPDENCDKPMEEIMVYPRIIKAYPELSAAVVIRDPDGVFSSDRPYLAEWIAERYEYTGLILLDKRDIIPDLYKIPTSSKAFFFNKNRELETILIPESGSKKERVRLYFDLARNYFESDS